MCNLTCKNCPACNSSNVFGVEDEPCCYKYMKYCKEVEHCIWKDNLDKINNNSETWKEVASTYKLEYRKLLDKIKQVKDIIEGARTVATRRIEEIL